MAIIITQGVEYQQLLEDVRALIRQEMTLMPNPATAAQPAASDLLTIQAAAKLLDVSVATIHEYKRRGLLPFSKIGGRAYLNRADVLTAGTRHQRSLKPARVKRAA